MSLRINMCAFLTQFGGWLYRWGAGGSSIWLQGRSHPLQFKAWPCIQRQLENLSPHPQSTGWAGHRISESHGCCSTLKQGIRVCMLEVGGPEPWQTNLATSKKSSPATFGHSSANCRFDLSLFMFGLQQSWGCHQTGFSNSLMQQLPSQHLSLAVGCNMDNTDSEWPGTLWVSWTINMLQSLASCHDGSRSCCWPRQRVLWYYILN